MLIVGCGVSRAPLQRLPGPPCGSAAAALVWFGPTDARERHRLSAWCDSVGAPVIEARPHGVLEQSSERGTGLVVVSWNVHEGAGDLVRLVKMLRPADVVVLAQEAMRRGDEVPTAIPSGVRPPRREHPSSAPGDIVAVARALDLWLAYVPSMRNGRHDREDRGCAILSTRPLSDAMAVELPWVSQRRVAVMATVAADGRRPFRVVSAHLDNRPGRRQQSEALASWLEQYVDDEVPLIVGADLNTWFGAGEETVGYIDRVVPKVKSCGDRPTFRLGRRLDYLFARGHDVESCVIGVSTYGSDHRPLLLTLRP
jgi:endonuclease/exonuclease/phosphatase family metal-dependent hydrolase